ncbi:mucin-17-like [Clarias gariepinus]|uniref:mucin-17-like n=1 Tax=Clarias gariepinus TaxID=13013 RepID=UPI00234C3CE4|nr:mucin-17-like [Clarias gariepinus]
MLWAMMRFYLLSIALVFCGSTNGFNVWNRTSILDWQAGRSNVTWGQIFQLATPGQLELPSRKGPNGNDGSGNFGNAVLTSEVPPAQRDSSFVQSSGGVAHIKQILNAYGQAAISHQPNSSQSSGFYWNEFIKPGNCGPLPSQHWPGKNLPGFQSPSSSQVLGFQTQLYQPSSPTQFSAGQSASAFQAQGPSASTPYQGQALSWHVSQDQSIPSSQSVVATNPTQSYQPNIPTQVLAGQSALPSQSMGALNLYQGLTSGRYLASLGQGIPPSPQPVATTNQISGFQNTYWPNTPVSSSQTISLPQSSSASQLFQGQTSGMSSISQDQSIPSFPQSMDTSSQITSSQTQSSFQPSTTTQLLLGQSDLPSQPIGGSSLYQGLTSGRYLASLGQSILSSQSVATTSQITDAQAQSFQPSTTTQALTGQSAISQDQSLQALAAYPVQASGWYTISQGQIPSQVSGFQAQSYQPSTATQVLPGQSASPVQSMGASALYQALTSGRYLASPDQSIPSSQSVATTSQITDAQPQSFQPSTTAQVLSGQSAAQDQSFQASASNLPQTSGWYTILLGKMIPSSQVSGVQTGSLIPSSPTQGLEGPSASIAPLQPLDALTQYQMQGSSRYSSSQNQSNPLFSQSVVNTNQISGIKNQTPSWANTTWTTANQSDSMSVSQGSYVTESSGNAKWYSVLQGRIMPSSSGLQVQPFQPSTATQVLPGQSASPVQSMGASGLYQGLTSGRYLTSLGQNIPPSPQPVPTTNQISGFQNTYFPNTPVSSSQSISLPQSSSASQLFQGQTSGMSSISQDQSIPSSFQSMDISSQVTSSQTQSSFQPSTTTRVLTEQSAIAQDKSLQASYPPQTSGWYTILQGQIPSPSQFSGFQAQSSYQPSTTTQVMPGQSVSSQSMGDSTLYQALTSGRYLTSPSQNILPSSQPIVTTKQISGFQNTYWPNTPVSSSQTISLPQSSSASQLFQGQTSGMSSISQDQSIPSSSQSMDTSSQITSSQTQSSFQPTTTTQVLTEQSALAPAQSLGNSLLCSSPTPGWYTTLLGKLIPSSQMSGFQPALQQPSSTSQPAASQAQSMGDSPLYQGLTSNINLTSQYQRTPSSFQSVAALNQISGIQNQTTYLSSTIQLAPSSSAFTPQSQSSGVTTMHQVPAEGLPNTSQDQSITASLQSVPSSSQISGFQNQTSYWPSATWVLPGDTHIAQIQSLGNPVSYPSQTSPWNTFLQSKIPSSQVSGFQAPSLYQPSTTQILAGQSDSTALLPSLGPMLYQGQALNRYNLQDQSFPSYFPSVATNQISGILSQPSFQPSSTTVASASEPSPSQAQSSSASAWYQGPTFGSLAAQSQNISSSSQSVVPTNQLARFQNLMFQPNTAQAWSWSGSTPQGAPQNIAGITFQGALPQLSSYGKKWPVTQ